jgi:hypothetical protein
MRREHGPWCRGGRRGGVGGRVGVGQLLASDHDGGQQHARYELRGVCVGGEVGSAWVSGWAGRWEELTVVDSLKPSSVPHHTHKATQHGPPVHARATHTSITCSMTWMASGSLRVRRPGSVRSCTKQSSSWRSASSVSRGPRFLTLRPRRGCGGVAHSTRVEGKVGGGGPGGRAQGLVAAYMRRLRGMQATCEQRLCGRLSSAPT